MDQKDYEQIDKLNLKWGLVHFTIFFVLIISGIVMKRIYHHPEYMMLFHGPAAVFLMVSGMKITAKQRRKFKSITIS